VNTLISNLPPDAPQPPILAPQDGILFLDRTSSMPHSRVT